MKAHCKISTCSHAGSLQPTLSQGVAKLLADYLFLPLILTAFSEDL